MQGDHSQPNAKRILELVKTNQLLDDNSESVAYGNARVASIIQKYSSELSNPRDAVRLRLVISAFNLLLVAVERPSVARELIDHATKLLR